MLELSDYEDLRKRPTGSARMSHVWHDLLFLHFPCEPGEIQDLLPEGLLVDTYPDSTGTPMAWIGLVPFGMREICWGSGSPMFGMRQFLEVNVRTYVSFHGRRPGVWFFSLDAANWLACQLARAAYSLPYHHAAMKMEANGADFRYEHRRLGPPPAMLEAEWTIGRPLPRPEPGSLEFFLLERYLLYTARGQKIHEGQVHHAPYEPCAVSVTKADTTLLTAAGLPHREFQHAMFVPSVKVAIYPLLQAMETAEVLQFAAG